MDAERIKALAVLGYNFNLHLFRSVLPREKKDQMEKFLGFFREDRISALTPDEYREIVNFERCVVCGLCPAHCRPMEEAPGRFLGPMHLAASSSRSHPEFVHDLDSLTLCAACGQCEPICPETVPVAAIAPAMRAMLWRVAAETLPPPYRQAAANLRAHGNIYGQPAATTLPSKDGAEAALVLGPRLRLLPDLSARLAETLARLGYDLTAAPEGSIGGVAQSLGLVPDTAWVDALGRSAVGAVIVADPEEWPALRADPRLAGKTVSSALSAVAEKWPAGMTFPNIAAPAAVHGRNPGQVGQARELLQQGGLATVELDRPGAGIPPVGWEGGIELVDPELASRLARRRLADARSAGAKTLVFLSADDAALLGQEGMEGVEPIFFFDLVHQALSRR
jgi:heterodisulfide reductase subunit C